MNDNFEYVFVKFTSAYVKYTFPAKENAVARKIFANVHLQIFKLFYYYLFVSSYSRYIHYTFRSTSLETNVHDEFCIIVSRKKNKKEKPYENANKRGKVRYFFFVLAFFYTGCIPIPL